MYVGLSREMHLVQRSVNVFQLSRLPLARGTTALDRRAWKRLLRGAKKETCRIYNNFDDLHSCLSACFC